MIKPIRVAPLSRTRLISEDPIVPNNMTQEQYLANQFASGNYAQPVAMAAMRPQSPVQELRRTAEIGLEGAKNQQRTASKLSTKVGGLLGDQQDYGGLLGGMQGDAALQGLFATMQAIGRPVRRGEDRYLGAVQYGQQQMDAAQKRGLGDLTTRMQLEKFALEKAAAERELAIKQQTKELLDQRLGGATPQSAAGQIELGEQYDRLPEDKKQDLRLSQVYQELATSLAPVNTDLSKQYFEQAKNLYDKAFVGELTPSEYRKESVTLGKEFKKTEFDPRMATVQAARKLTSLGTDENPMDAVAAVFTLMKSLDPTSVVRDSEVRMVTGAGGLYNQLMSMTKGALGKGRIDPAMFNAMRLTAIKLAEAAEMDYAKQVETQEKYADRAKLDPSLAVWADSLGVQDLRQYRAGITMTEEERDRLANYFNEEAGQK